MDNAWSSSSPVPRHAPPARAGTWPSTNATLPSPSRHGSNTVAASPVSRAASNGTSASMTADPLPLPATGNALSAPGTPTSSTPATALAPTHPRTPGRPSARHRNGSSTTAAPTASKAGISTRGTPCSAGANIHSDPQSRANSANTGRARLRTDVLSSFTVGPRHKKGRAISAALPVFVVLATTAAARCRRPVHAHVRAAAAAVDRRPAHPRLQSARLVLHHPRG